LGLQIRAIDVAHVQPAARSHGTTREGAQVGGLEDCGSRSRAVLGRGEQPALGRELRALGGHRERGARGRAPPRERMFQSFTEESATALSSEKGRQLSKGLAFFFLSFSWHRRSSLSSCV